MANQETYEIYLKMHNECKKNFEFKCKGCPFATFYMGELICLVKEFQNEVIAQLVNKMFVPLNKVEPANVKEKTTLYVKAPLSAEEFEKQLKALLPQQLALEPLPKEDRAIKMPESSKHDNVNHPKHYCKGGLECIDAIRAAVSDLQGVEAVYAGNVIKYVWRFKGKNGLEDLKKAKRCLEWLIEEVKNNG